MFTAARGHGGLFDLFLCCFMTIAPFLVIDGWQTSPLLALWAAGFGTRWYFGDRQVVTDCFIFGIFAVHLERFNIEDIILNKGNELKIPIKELGFVVPLLLAVQLAVLAFLPQWYEYRTNEGTKKLPEGISKWDRPYPKSRIFPCQTKHARMFPQRHAFEYSYLQCGFPIVPAGVTADGNGVGCGDDVHLGSWWLQIRAQDYLKRGNGALGFYGKLKMYLQEQNVKDAEWSYAYLVTAPRFFGYAFNPVSFWYIYNSDHQLKKMILEVNNTFGERRMYLLDGSNVPSSPSTGAETLESEPVAPCRKSRFTDIWMKDFHVSPFNSRKGSYVLKAQDPFPCVTYDNPLIDNTITLISSKDHGKLVARLNSTGKALELESLGVLNTARFVLSWWWVGLMTFPRIVKEAAKLYYKRKLQVWFRPEVVHTSVGRSPTSTEIELYQIFKSYLHLMVHQSEEPFSVTLHTAIPNEPVQCIATTHLPGRNQEYIELEIRVLTPAFYSRFVHYAYTSEAFDRECIFTDEKNRTLWISRPQVLPLLLKRPSISEVGLGSSIKRSYLDKLRWTILKKLRCAPATPAYPTSTTGNTEATTEDVRSLPHSELDKYVLEFRGRESAREYRRMVTKLFLAQRFSLGFAEGIGLLDLIARTLLCLHGAYQLSTLQAHHNRTGINGCSTNMSRDESLNACSGYAKATQTDWWLLVGTTVSLSACHLVGISKGYN